MGVSLYSIVETAVNKHILSDNYLFSAPNNAHWHGRLHAAGAPERDRLEFVGDSVMHLAVSEELYRRYPSRGPGFYTTVRSALTANKTFCSLMRKAGISGDPKLSEKAVGDAFETMIAAFYLEDGLDAVHAWVRRHFCALMGIAEKTYDDGFAVQAEERRKVKAEKLTRAHQKLAKAHKRMKRLKTQQASPRKIRKQTDFVELSGKARKFEEKRRAAALRAKLTVRKIQAEIIDLTADSDDEGEHMDDVSNKTGEVLDAETDSDIEICLDPPILLRSKTATTKTQASSSSKRLDDGDARPSVGLSNSSRPWFVHSSPEPPDVDRDVDGDPSDYFASPIRLGSSTCPITID